MKHLIYIYLLLLPFASTKLFAQNTQLQGKVVDTNKVPVAFVAVFNTTNQTYTYTDSIGNFSLSTQQLPCQLEFTMLGYRNRTVVFENTTPKTLVLQEESLELPGVVVTAKLKKSDKGSSSYAIGTEAIKQTQAMSIGDILLTIPGSKIAAPEMTKVQQVSTRTAEHSHIEAFASKIVLDGVSISNDANLQAYNPAQGIFGGKSAVGGGLDLRSITPESIEKIEVIAGVPSAKYGNLASGTVLITRKITPQPLTANFSLNATNYQAGISQGLKLPNDNLLSYSLSGTYATLSPTQKKDYYQSIAASLLWRTTLSKQLEWTNTLSLNGTYSMNNKDFEEEDVLKNEEEFSTKHLSVASTGHLNCGINIDYTLAADIKKQYSLKNTKETNGPLPITEGLETGTYKSPLSSFIYHLQQEVIGTPINLQADIEASKYSQWKDLRFLNKIGLQYSFDKNLGEGRIGGKSIVGNTGAIGSRANKFKEIPALRMLSAFYEAKTTYQLTEERSLSIISGIRYDNINAKYNLWSPRLSGNLKLNNWINLRAAWGISYKAPALIHLYPGPTYVDFTNMSFFSNNKAERMALITTHKIEQTNEHLQPIKGTLGELGIDLSSKYGELKVTAFKKEVNNGIISSPELLILPKQEYKVTKRYPDRMPDVAPIPNDIKKIMLTYNRMKNDVSTHTTGAEIIFNSKKIEATQTSFDLQLSFLRTKTRNKAYRMTASQFTVGENLPRIGVYQNPEKKSYQGIGSLTVIQHIPELKLIFTLRTELSFYDYYRYEASPIYPIAYYTRDSELIHIPTQERTDKKYRDLFLSKGEFSRSIRPPFYPNFHLQARKELKNGSSMQFYVQNVIWHNPTYEDKGVRWTLNSDIYFGLGLTINL